jgi:glycosidase
MKQHWAWQTVFYHIYPLGLCDAPERNDFNSPPKPRLLKVRDWLDHLQDLGFNALYLGPVFESTTHGYDTADYYQVDRRLGDRETLARLAKDLRQRGLRLILDGVFHHVGRDFWAFRDLLKHGPSSRFADWFCGVDFQKQSPWGDPFAYQGWNGHYDLVKLNLRHPEVKGHLLEAVRNWLSEFEIDGLRLDAADCLDPDFLRELAAFTRGLRPDFWLMGEVVHGDYRRYANSGMLDSVTNYEAYKSLYSCHNDLNYFEMAHSLDRQFGKYGLYRDLPLYGFADNHDVDRVAGLLNNPAHLYPLYIILFTMPGSPSVYYGSEWGLNQKKAPHSDRPLRPALDPVTTPQHAPHPDLAGVIKRLISLRRNHPPLWQGDCRNLLVQRDHLALARSHNGQNLVVAVNAASETRELRLKSLPAARLTDLLNPGESFTVSGSRVSIPVHPCWGRIMLAEG